MYFGRSRLTLAFSVHSFNRAREVNISSLPSTRFPVGSFSVSLSLLDIPFYTVLDEGLLFQWDLVS